MTTSLPPGAGGWPRRRPPVVAATRIRRLAEICVRRRVAADGAFTRAVRRLLEKCLPHKSGRFKGTRVGYDPDRHNANCRLSGRSGGGVRRSSPSGASSGVRGKSSGPAPGGTSPPAATSKVGGPDRQNSTRKAKDRAKAKKRIAPPETAVETAERARVSRANAGSIRSRVGTENERLLARKLGPEYRCLPDNEAVDHVRKDRHGVEHGGEVKTLLTNKRAKTHMHPTQQKRKEAWVRGLLRGIKDPRERPDPTYNAAKGRILHSLVVDHREAYYDSVYGGADFSKRKFDQLYYARGARPWDTKDMIGVTSPRVLDDLQKLSPEKYLAVYKKFAGKMYPSGKPHPVVTKIVGGETLAQVRQLHQNRTEKHNKAVARLQRWERKAKGLEKQFVAAQAAVGEPGGQKQKKAARARVAKIAANLDATRRMIDTSRTRVDVRKHKLDLTTAALKLKQAEAGKGKLHERVH